MGEKLNWGVISTYWKANDHCTPQCWLELYELHEDLAMLVPTQKALDEIMAAVEKQSDDLKFIAKNNSKWSWCDALYMSPPTFARLAKITGGTKYRDYLHTWWWKVSDFYYDTEESLYFRDETFFNKKEPNGKKVFWSRGNGWVIGGLVRVLQYLDEDDPMRPKYQQQLREMCMKLAEIQSSDGLWRSGLLDPVAHQAETSGSAFFIYGLAYAINEGVVDRDTFEQVVINGWVGLCRYVKEDGRFTGVQPIGDSPVKYDRGCTMPYDNKTRPYVKYASNNKDVIHFVMTQAHPQEYVGTGIYHGYIKGGAVYKSDGTLIKKLSDGPVEIENLTNIYQGDKNHEAWTIDLHL